MMAIDQTNESTISKGLSIKTVIWLTYELFYDASEQFFESNTTAQVNLKKCGENQCYDDWKIHFSRFSTISEMKNYNGKLI